MKSIYFVSFNTVPCQLRIRRHYKHSRGDVGCVTFFEMKLFRVLANSNLVRGHARSVNFPFLFNRYSLDITVTAKALPITTRAHHGKYKESMTHPGCDLVSTPNQLFACSSFHFPFLASQKKN
jgi:hypothetical protein